MYVETIDDFEYITLIEVVIKFIFALNENLDAIFNNWDQLGLISKWKAWCNCMQCRIRVALDYKILIPPPGARYYVSSLYYLRCFPHRLHYSSQPICEPWISSTLVNPHLSRITNYRGSFCASDPLTDQGSILESRVVELLVLATVRPPIDKLAVVNWSKKHLRAVC